MQKAHALATDMHHVLVNHSGLLESNESHSYVCISSILIPRSGPSLNRPKNEGLDFHCCANRDIRLALSGGTLIWCNKHGARALYQSTRNPIKATVQIGAWVRDQWSRHVCQTWSWQCISCGWP